MEFRELSRVGTALGRRGLTPGGAGPVEWGVRERVAAWLSFVAPRAICVLTTSRCLRVSSQRCLRLRCADVSRPCAISSGRPGAAP